MLAVASAWGQQTEPACRDEASARSVVANLDAEIIQLRDERKRSEADLQAQISRAADDLVKKGTWTQESRAAFFAKLQDAKEFKEFEKRKRTSLGLYTLAAQTFVVQKERNALVPACNSAEDMKTRLRDIGRINDAQYAFMLSKVQAADPAEAKGTR